MATDIVVPTLGESVTEATVSQWLKQVGDTVAADEAVLELETDKVTLEVNAPAAGVLSEMVVEAGANVGVGALLGRIGEGVAAGTAAPAPAAAPSPAQGGGLVDVPVPALGESVTEAEIKEWLKSVGDTVAVDEDLVELETDKASMPMPSPVAGVVREIRANPGDTVAVGTVICTIAAGVGAAAASAPAASAPAPAAAATTAADDVADGPAVAKLLEEHKLDRSQIPATGKDGRLTKADVQAFIAKGGAAAKPASAPAAGPAPSAAAPRPAAPPPTPVMTAANLPPRPEDPREERVRMTKLRRTIAQRLKDAQNTAAMLTTFNEVDMANVMALRQSYRDKFEKKHGGRLGFMGFFVKACVQALKELPAINGEIYGDELVYKNYYDIGIAVGSPQGLVVPVVRDCDQKSIPQIELDIADYGRRARDGKLSLAEMQGGTFTITNGGVFGSLLSTPILNPPQSAILGMHKTMERPMVVGGKVEARPMMYLALSYDHRIVDGREAVTFLVRVKELIEDPQRVLLEV